MEGRSKKFAIVISSCFAYDDALQNFFYLLNEFKIVFEREFDVYVISDFKHDLPNHVNLLLSKEQDWQKRLNSKIQSIDVDYFLFLLDDYYFGESFSVSKLLRYFELVESNKFNYLRLINIPSVNNSNSITKLDQLNVKHSVNLQAAIWDKDYFMKFCYEGSPWAMEVLLDKSNHINTYSTTFDFLNIKNGILQGKKIRATSNYFNNNNITLPYQDRDTLSHTFTFMRTLKTTFNRFVSNRSLRKKLKKILTKLGMKFVTED